MKRLLEYEWQLQINCTTWFRYKYQKVLMCHIPNESDSKPQYRKKLRDMGVRAGMPDVMIFKQSGPYIGLAVELKSKTGRLEPEQKIVLRQLNNEGWKTHVINNIDDFMKEVIEYMSL